MVKLQKEFKLEDLKMKNVLFVNKGEWSNDNHFFRGLSEEGHYSIGYSDILSFLIKKAGTICERYASDLFIDWCWLEKQLKNLYFEGGKFLFGFRDSGVDGNAFVLTNLNNGRISTYKELYMLEIETSINDIGGKDIQFRLGTVKY